MCTLHVYYTLKPVSSKASILTIVVGNHDLLKMGKVVFLLDKLKGWLGVFASSSFFFFSPLEIGPLALQNLRRELSESNSPSLSGRRYGFFQTTVLFTRIKPKE